ncbi:MAG: DUF4337 family protein [Rhodospirillales bacterium]|nr:DUF4337 family protein [Rhodospirillales bacterium]
MIEAAEHARETLERHEHLEAHPRDLFARRAGLLISVLAVALALAQAGKDSAQNAAIAAHLRANDTWTFYAQKVSRIEVLRAETELLDALPASPAALAGKAAAADRLRNLTENSANTPPKLQAAAEASMRTQERMLHRYHRLETAVGALSIAIVLVSAAVVTRLRWLAWAGGGLGLLGATGAVAAVLGLI